MNLKYKYLILALFLLILSIFFYKVKENFAATSPATLMQLRASGAQDIYLTGSSEKPAQPILTNQSIIQKI